MIPDTDVLNISKRSSRSDWWFPSPPCHDEMHIKKKITVFYTTEFKKFRKLLCALASAAAIPAYYIQQIFLYTKNYRDD